MPHRTDDRCPVFTIVVFLLVACGCAGFVEQVRAQGSASTPSIVLSRPLSVRSAGMNGAGAALVGNSGAVFSNPAGIATIRHIGIEGAYRPGPSDGSITSGALAWRLRQFDIGVGLARFEPGSDGSSIPVPGVAENSELAGVGSIVYRFGIIAVAGSGKYVRRVVDDSPEGAFSSDAGLAIAVFDIIAIGFSMQNLGGNWGAQSAVEMPGLTRLAAMWNYVDPLETFRLLSTVELQWPEGQNVRLVVGGEGGMVVHDVGLFGRAAYAAEPTGSVFSHMTYGGSVTMANMALDYAYQESDISGEPAHRFGFRLVL